jgi:hypothetical protein
LKKTKGIAEFARQEWNTSLNAGSVVIIL